MLPKVVENTLEQIEDDRQRLKYFKIIGQEKSTTIVMESLHMSNQDRVTPLLKHRSPVLISRDRNRLQGWLSRQTGDCFERSCSDLEVDTDPADQHWTFEDTLGVNKEEKSGSALGLELAHDMEIKKYKTASVQTELQMGIDDSVEIGVQSDGIKYHNIGIHF